MYILCNIWDLYFILNNANVSLMAYETNIIKALSKTYDVNTLFPVLGLQVETVSLLPYFTNTEKGKFNFKEILRVANDMKQNEVHTSVLLIMSMAKREIPITMCLDGKKNLSYC